MRYVMVPVPSEFVLDVMRWVLFRAPEEAGDDTGRDQSRIRGLLEEAEDGVRSLLDLVAAATRDDSPLRLSDAAAELGQDANILRATLRRINATGLGGGRELVRVSNETAVGPLGKRGKVTYLSMRPEHARMIRSLTTSPDSQTA